MNSFSVLIPVLNEEAYILNLIDSISNQSLSPTEIIFIDGGSTDKTLDILRSSQLKEIKILDNPNKIVPYALNIGIESSKTNIIIRLDAHTKYSPDYFEKILEKFSTYPDVSIVGGPTNVAYSSKFQKYVGVVITSSFALGGGSVHNIDYNGLTDSVTFGAWRRQVFDLVGGFNVIFKRNQDDEFHLRCKLAGLKIYQFSDIKLYYYPRSDFYGLFKQYFQYGLYKPAVFRVNNVRLTYRQFIPLFFLLYIWSLPLLFFFNYPFIYLIPLLFYFVLGIYFALKSKTSIFYFISISLCIQLSYALGLLAGFNKKF